MGFDSIPATASFGDALRLLRQARGYGLRQFAARISYSSGHLSQVETGAKAPTQRLVEACERELRLPGRLAPLLRRDTRVRPAQQPLGVHNLIGRDGDLASVLDALRRSGIALVDGQPGVGKTALALCCTKDPEIVDRYPDGVLFADLLGFTPGRSPARVAEVAADFLSALEIRSEHVPTGENARVGLLRSILAQRQLLVVLDNARSEEQVRRLLPGNEGCGAIVTTRRRLAGLTIRDGVSRVTLTPLAPQAAIQLLVRMAGGRTSDSRRFAELAELCGRLPLALRVIGDRLGTAADVPTLCTEMRTAPIATLSEDEDQTVAVRAALDASYRALRPRERETFRLLGLVPGTAVDGDGLAVLTAGTRAGASARLRRLWQDHLVHPTGGGAWTVPTLVRAYAGDLVSPEDFPGDHAAGALLHDGR